MNPEINITKKAGPSAESAKEKSSPQCSQRGASARNPANSLPLPQRGQRPHSPAMTGDGGFCEEGSASCPMRTKLHRVPVILARRCSVLGALPSSLWGGVGGGRREILRSKLQNAPPPSPALP